MSRCVTQITGLGSHSVGKRHTTVALCHKSSRNERNTSSSSSPLSSYSPLPTMWIAELATSPMSSSVSRARRAGRLRIGHIAPQLHQLPEFSEDLQKMKLLPTRTVFCDATSELEKTDSPNVPITSSSRSLREDGRIVTTGCPPIRPVVILDESKGEDREQVSNLSMDHQRRRERRKERRKRCCGAKRVTSDPELEEEVNEHKSERSMHVRQQPQPRFWRAPPEVGVKGVGYAYGYADSRGGTSNVWRSKKYIRDRMKKVVLVS